MRLEESVRRRYCNINVWRLCNVLQDAGRKRRDRVGGLLQRGRMVHQQPQDMDSSKSDVLIKFSQMQELSTALGTQVK
ncbi:hypothetical protein N7463_005835 [Penicillium fimorum]|uniref:Uncharacterized protein n=1 Tax=Penicillium fimorum TaxID=1882269 RepID=A0A9W9XU80_9EURO|nr:hypothetical protein N7463_005835 [Penicillium fimorum]